MFISLKFIFDRLDHNRSNKVDKNSHAIFANRIHEATQRAVVTKTVKGFEEAGRVRFQATWWPAFCTQNNITLEPGQRCRVVNRNNTTLIVEPIDSKSVVPAHVKSHS